MPFCTHCGSKLSDANRFCGNCGQRVGVKTSAAPPQTSGAEQARIEQLGRPHLLHTEQTFPDASELFPEVAEAIGDGWPGPMWGGIWCQRSADGTWSIWFTATDENGVEEELERTAGIVTPQEFTDVYDDCGVDYGCHPDGTELSEHENFFEREDPVFARALRDC